MENFIKNIRELFKFSKSKTLGFLIFFAGTVIGWDQKNTDFILQAWLLSTVLIGGKTSLTTIKDIKTGGIK